MKLGKYLAAGKSWAGGNGIGRYQMRHALALPKFISPRNPFKRESVAELAAAPAMTINAATPSPVADVQLAMPSVPAVPWKVRVMKLVEQSGELAKRAALFCLDHNPFSAIGKPQLPRIPRFGKPEMQGELSLDKVKVLRSDLTHADLEVVQLGTGQK